MTTSTVTVEEAAASLAGNWKKFESFAWLRSWELTDPDAWAVVYTHHRDSGLLAESNAGAVAKALGAFATGDDPDVVAESHGHWAVGHIDGFSLRVFKGGLVTDAFRTYHELARRMDDHPVLDEDDYSGREYAATLENIDSVAWRVKREFALPEGWAGDVYSWLSERKPSAVENADDRGGSPSEDDVREAFVALGYRPAGG